MEWCDASSSPMFVVASSNSPGLGRGFQSLSLADPFKTLSSLRTLKFLRRTLQVYEG